MQELFQKIRIAARINLRTAAEAQQMEGKLKNDTAQLESFAIGSRSKARNFSLARLATCGAFILAAAVPLLLVRRNRRRERDEQSRKCPRCLNKDTLEYDATASDADAGDDLQARFRLKVCSACEYEIRENYVRQNRLCFPTVGVRASGKTHWMLMLYDTIKNSNIPVASAIKKIASREDARFDDLVRRLLYEGGRLEATVLGLPHPLTFHVNDADPLGPNKTMVNLFDFSGEMRNFNIDTNEFRRRALLCEGFTLFLDPTQVTQQSDLTIEDQIQTLGQFAEEMHAIRGLAAETPIDLPIAVCVSKIDLLVTRNPMGTQAVELVTALRETLTQKVDLALIHQRSQLCARAMPLMFPGWNVERAAARKLRRAVHVLPDERRRPRGGRAGRRRPVAAHDCPLRDDRALALAAPYARLLRAALTSENTPARSAMGWPSASDYSGVIQNPKPAFRDPRLKECAVEIKGRIGMPWVRSGARASSTGSSTAPARWPSACSRSRPTPTSSRGTDGARIPRADQAGLHGRGLLTSPTASRSRGASGCRS